MRSNSALGYGGVLSEEFDLFYYKLLKVKEQALSTRSAPVPKDDALTITVHGPALAIQDDLKAFLENQFERLRGMAVGADIMYARDAFYACVALVDEVLINLPWQGGDYWRQNCMEIKFFQTQIAGEKIFQQIDYLLKNPDPLQKELARIYLLCLSLGFLGKYRDGDSSAIDEYKQKLFAFVKQRATRFNRPDPPSEIFTCGLDYVFSESSGKRLPDLRRWGWTAFAVFAIYLFVSYGMWSFVSRDLRWALLNILSPSERGGRV